MRKRKNGGARISAPPYPFEKAEEDIEMVMLGLVKKKVLASFSYQNREWFRKGRKCYLVAVLNTVALHEVHVDIKFIRRVIQGHVEEVNRGVGKSELYFGASTSRSLFINTLKDTVMIRFAGLKGEDLVADKLGMYIRRNGRDIFQSFRRATPEEDKRGIDFYVKVRIDGVAFEFGFDLKITEKSKRLARRRNNYGFRIQVPLRVLQENFSEFMVKLRNVAYKAYYQYHVPKKQKRAYA